MAYVHAVGFICFEGHLCLLPTFTLSALSVFIRAYKLMAIVSDLAVKCLQVQGVLPSALSVQSSQQQKRRYNFQRLFLCFAAPCRRGAAARRASGVCACRLTNTSLALIVLRVQSVYAIGLKRIFIIVYAYG